MIHGFCADNRQSWIYVVHKVALSLFVDTSSLRRKRRWSKESDIVMLLTICEYLLAAAWWSVLEVEGQDTHGVPETNPQMHIFVSVLERKAEEWKSRT